MKECKGWTMEYLLLASGIPPHPGPGQEGGEAPFIDLTVDSWYDDMDDDEILIESINVTSLEAHREELRSRRAHVTPIQEHS